MTRILKNRIAALLAACVTVLSVGCSTEKTDTGTENITVTGAQGYTKTSLVVGESWFADDEQYVITQVSEYFRGFDMLVSNKGEHNGGYIIPGIDGIVYILSPSGSLPDGWRLLADNVIKYTVPDTDSVADANVYFKMAYTGRGVEIPIVGGDIPVIPLGRRIEYIIGNPN